MTVTEGDDLALAIPRHFNKLALIIDATLFVSKRCRIFILGLSEPYRFDIKIHDTHSTSVAAFNSL